MEFNVHKIALAAATTLVIIYAVGALLVALFPGAAAQMFAWIIPVTNLSALGGINITFGGFFAGLLEVAVLGYLAVWLFGALHNGFTRSAAWSESERSLRRAHA